MRGAIKGMAPWLWLAIIFGGLGLVVVWTLVSIWLNDVKRRRQERKEH